MKLTSRDLTSEAQVVDETLQRYLRLASSWGAIVLIDKASIFLARRDISDRVGSSLTDGWYCTPFSGMLFH